MRRFPHHDCQTKNPLSASKKHFASAFLVTFLILSFDPTALLAQTDPFAQTKPATANPFADIPTSDANKVGQNESEAPGNANPFDEAPSSARASANPFDEIPEDSDLKDSSGSDLRDDAETAGSATTTGEGGASAESLIPNAGKSVSTEQQEPETDLTVVPKSSRNLIPKAPTSTPDSGDWLGWLMTNWYYPAAAFVLAFVLLLFGGLRSPIKAKKSVAQPRIKKGAFKKSTRFQDKNGKEKKSEQEEVASADAPLDDSDESSSIFDFDEEDNSSVSDSSSNSDAAAALAGGTASIDEDNDFLELTMDDSEETSAEKLVDSPEELGDFSPQASDVEADQSAASESPDEDDDDFLDLMMDDSEETASTQLVEESEELNDISLKGSDGEVVESVTTETTDDDDFFDMMLEDDEDASEPVEDAALIPQSVESNDIDATVESDAPLELDDASDEFTFGFEDDAPVETSPAGLVAEEVTDKAEEVAALEVNDTPALLDEVTPSEANELLAGVTDDSDLEDIALDEGQSLVAGGVTAAAGALAGFGALLGAKSVSDPKQTDEDVSSEELREQLAQALEKQQQNETKITAQQSELEAFKAKLDVASSSVDATEKLQQRADDLADKLASAEKESSEFQSQLSAAESNIDALEKEKEEIAKQLEEKAGDSEAVEKLETELSELKSRAEETAVANEQLQSESEKLRKEISDLKEINDQRAGDLVRPSVSSDKAGVVEGAATTAVSADSSEFQQLKAQFEEELALRKRTEAMLVEAEQQRTDVATALRDLRKQTKEQSVSGASSEELDALKSQLAESRSVNEDLEQQVDGFRKKLEQEYSVAKELTGKLAASQEKVSAVTILEDDWKQKLETLESEVAAKGKENGQLAADLKATKESLGELEGTVVELQAKEDGHKAILAKHEASLLESQSNLESAIAEKAEMEVSLDDIKQKAGALSYGQLEEALASVARLGKERNDLGLRLEQTRTTGEEVARHNAQLSERVAQLEKQLDSSNAIASQLEDARKQLDEEKNRAIETDKKNNALQLQVDSLKQNFESLDRQRLSLKENLEARDKQAADGERAMNKEADKLTRKIAALEESLSNSDSAEDIRLQLTDGKEQLRNAKQQNSILAGRVSGLEQQLKSRHADTERLDSVQQQLVSQTELVSVAKEENATLKERVGQLDEQIKVERSRSGRLEQIQATSERVALEEKSKGLLQQLNQATGLAEKNERLNKQIGFLQRDLEAAEKKSRSLEQRLGGDASDERDGSVSNDKLERIVVQLESQGRQISELVAENRNMATKLASRKTTASKKSASTKTTKTTKRKSIPKGNDDLTEIVGIGPLYMEKLHKAGVKTFRQIAGWSKEDIAKYSKKLGFKSSKRIDQEAWISQAKKLS